MNKEAFIEDIVFLTLREDSSVDEISKYIKELEEKDWDEVVKFITFHSLFPAFYDRLITLKIKDIPSQVLSYLKSLYLLNLKRCLFLEEELFKVLDSLGSAGIPAIPLKGIILSRLLYGDIALRQAPCDMDILIPYDKIDKTEKNLLSLGYSFTMKEEQINLTHKYRKEITLQKNLHGFNLAIDLHWDFHEKFHDNYTHAGSFLENSEVLTIDNHRILFPLWEELLLFLSTASIARFEFVTLKYIQDIHCLINGKEINWEKLIQKSKLIRLDHLLYFSLKITKELFKTKIPPEVLKEIQPFLLKEKFLNLWITKKNILQNRDRIANSYIWRIPVLNLLYSNNIYDWFRLVYKKIFLPPQEVTGLIYNHPMSEGTWGI